MARTVTIVINIGFSVGWLWKAAPPLWRGRGCDFRVGWCLSRRAPSARQWQGSTAIDRRLLVALRGKSAAPRQAILADIADDPDRGLIAL
jgi:hypothetical protein